MTAKILSLSLVALMFASCSVPVANDSKIKGAATQGEIRVSDLSARSKNTTKVTSEELSYEWNYPKYPQDYKIDLDNRDPNGSSYMSNRQAVYDQSTTTPQIETALGPLGSYAGPWIEGEEAKLMPVSNPNIVLGEALLKVVGSEITDEMKPKLTESPFQAFLKLRKIGTDVTGKLRTVTVVMPAVNTKKKDTPVEPAEFTVQLDKESLWSITMTLYRAISPDWKTRVALKADPKVMADGAGVFGNCNMCHGADGWGLGHSGLKLQPPPANFREPRRLYNRTDAHLRQVLHNGIYGSAMPPWGDKLGDAEINVVVAYLRHFTYSTEIPVMSSPPVFKDQ